MSGSVSSVLAGRRRWLASKADPTRTRRHESESLRYQVLEVDGDVARSCRDSAKSAIIYL
jgi:hypothetical protein